MESSPKAFGAHLEVDGRLGAPIETLCLHIQAFPDRGIEGRVVDLEVFSLVDF